MIVEYSNKPYPASKPLTVREPAVLWGADEQFLALCNNHRELRIERSAQGACEIMAPTGGITGWRNSRLTTLLSLWAEQDGRGVVFDSSTGFVLPNGAIRSPDVSWVQKSRLATLTMEQKQRFLALPPDFVIELSSPNDSIATLQSKLQEYIGNGVQLGWLIEPETRRVTVYQAQQAPACIEQPEILVSDALLPGFKLELQKLWDIGF